ncbi:MAG: alpha/beta fold hydrolase [Coriobacteriia bacterium]|nr:alpha/beta fold hydrolase [Coriobacteriia bacterium]
MAKAKRKMTAAEKAAARVPEMPEPEPAPVVPREPAPMPKHERRNRFALLVGGLILLVALSFTLYTCNYSHETDEARAALTTTQQVAVDEQADWVAFGDADADVGFVFYPGGKVAAEAYAPLMHQLAEKGMFCVIAKVPFNLAFFKTDAAAAVIQAYPQVKTWYTGGHSLGGVAACQWAADNPDRVAGLILLGSYTSVDLTGTSLRVLSLYGSNDQVMNRENYVESQALLPADVREVVIEGGNHAQFGNYGTQEGDGEATITAAEQQKQAVDAILKWVS